MSPLSTRGTDTIKKRGRMTQNSGSQWAGEPDGEMGYWSCPTEAGFINCTQAIGHVPNAPGVRQVQSNNF